MRGLYADQSAFEGGESPAWAKVLMEQTRIHRPYVAIVYLLASTLFFSASDVMGKWLTAVYPVVQVTWLRSVTGTMILFIAICITANLSKLKTKRPGWHALRSVMSGFAVLMIFYGLQSIPLAEYVSLTFAIPFFVAIFSPWFLKEAVSRQSWIAIGVGFIGVLIILRPTPAHFHIAHLTTLLVSFLIGILVNSARYLGATENNWSLNFYLPIAGIILFFYWAMSAWITPTFNHWLMFISLGLSQTLALGCYIEAMRLARPAVIAPLDYVRLIWTIISGFLIWRELPDQYTWIGIIIIVISGIYVLRHSRVSESAYS